MYESILPFRIFVVEVGGEAEPPITSVSASILTSTSTLPHTPTGGDENIFITFHCAFGVSLYFNKSSIEDPTGLNYTNITINTLQDSLDHDTKMSLICR